MTRFQKFCLLVIGAGFLLIAATGNIRWTQLAAGDRHGTAAKGQASDGTGGSGNATKYTADGSLTDGGSPPLMVSSLPISAPCLGTNSIPSLISVACAGGGGNPVPTLTWDNQNGSTVSDISGTEQLCTSTVGGGGISARYTAAPATPYNLTVQMVINPFGEGNTHQFSTNLMFRESSTGKYVGLGLNVNSSGGSFISVDNFTSATTYSSSPYSLTYVGFNPIITWQSPSFIYLRERDDGTNISFYYSLDGNNFFQLATSLSRTAFMLTGPNQIAWAVSQSTTGSSVCSTIMQWVTP